MASIIRRGDGWRALVRRKGHKSICKTFHTKAQAEVWARKIEAEFDRARTPTASGLTIGQLIQTYRELREKSRPILDTTNEHYMLRHLQQGLGECQVESFTPQQLAGWCQMRAEEGAGPYTINMEVSKLGTVLRYAAVASRITLPDVVGQSRPLLAHLGLIGGGGKRERRATEDELHRIMDALPSHFGDVVAFAVTSTLRRGEIFRIRWEDLDERKRLVLVRDRKHPRRKKGNDEWVPLLGVAWEIVQRQQRNDERIFPYHPQTLSKNFKSTCDALGIVDLHFHDMRHEGTSQLFEQGYAIEEVALVTGHKDWRQLRRYTQLKPESLHRR
jgi:integrase